MFGSEQPSPEPGRAGLVSTRESHPSANTNGHLKGKGKGKVELGTASFENTAALTNFDPSFFSSASFSPAFLGLDMMVNRIPTKDQSAVHAAPRWSNLFHCLNNFSVRQDTTRIVVSKKYDVMASKRGSPCDEDVISAANTLVYPGALLCVFSYDITIRPARTLDQPDYVRNHCADRSVEVLCDLPFK